MSRFDVGVKWYTTGTITVPVHFPEDDIRCKWCKYLRADVNGERYKCTITNEILYTTATVGNDCPIEFKEGNDNERRIQTEENKD